MNGYRIPVALAVVVVAAILIIPPETALAADGDIVISEVMYNAVTASEEPYEWVEIYNKGSGSVDIQNWQICDSTGCDTITAASTLIGPGEYWLIGNYDTALQIELAAESKVYNASRTLFLGSAGTPNSIGNGLTNSSDAVYLKTSSTGNVIDCISWATGGDTTCTGLTYVDGGNGFYSTLYSAVNGQSIMNIGGTWGYHGPTASTANQGSPYASNMSVGGATAVTLRALTARAPRSPWAAALPALGLVAAGGAVAWRRRKPTAESKPYEPPAVVYQAPLEVRAGSPLNVPFAPLDRLNPINLADSEDAE